MYRLSSLTNYAVFPIVPSLEDASIAFIGLVVRKQFVNGIASSSDTLNVIGLHITPARYILYLTMSALDAQCGIQ
jgi:hypothetical protein